MRSLSDALSSSKGSILLEALVALAVIALVTSTSISLISPGKHQNLLIQQAKDVRSFLFSTRRQARSLAVTVSVALDLNKRQIVTSSGVTLPLRPDLEITLSGVASGSNLTSSRIYFFNDGTSSGGEIVVDDHKTKAKIRTNWATGLAEITEPI